MLRSSLANKGHILKIIQASTRKDDDGAASEEDDEPPDDDNSSTHQDGNDALMGAASQNGDEISQRDDLEKAMTYLEKLVNIQELKWAQCSKGRPLDGLWVTSQSSINMKNYKAREQEIESTLMSGSEDKNEEMPPAQIRQISMSHLYSEELKLARKRETT